jgi:hypothetical protein
VPETRVRCRGANEDELRKRLRWEKIEEPPKTPNAPTLLSFLFGAVGVFGGLLLS